MAQITDSQVIAFVNGTVRPLAETIRLLDANNEDAIAQYFSKISPIVSSNVATDTIEDGRDAEGVSRLTLGDIQNFITLLSDMKTKFDGAGVRDTIRKPTVRQLLI